MKRKIKNPVLSGFYPDPSICKADGVFYMVCSSFELYPGIPIFRSTDLAHWEQIGHVMTKENGFHVKANTFTGGVMAPTIRYYDGIFYVINTNFSDRGNFIVEAKNPAGPWSEPYWLTDVDGIDASLFIDEDGTAYIIGTGNVVQRADGVMDRGIYMCEFDLKEKKLIGEKKVIWDSALRNAPSPEAPHVYKVGDYYYLIIAEGGTEHYHSVAVARCKEPMGWYEGYQGNPIMTHRHMGYQCDISNVGHADLVETDDGNWYAVLLASRPLGGYYKNLGRETFLCPVIWEREWPVFSPESGRIDWEYNADEKLPWCEPEKELVEEWKDGMPLSYCFWGTPYGNFWNIKDKNLQLQCLARRINEPLRCLLDESENERRDDCVSFVGRRVTDFAFEFSCKMNFVPEEEESAGVVLLQASNHQYRLEAKKEEGKTVLQLVLSETEMDVPPHFPNFHCETRETVLVTVPHDEEEVTVKIKVNEQDLSVHIENKGKWNCIAEHLDVRKINPEIVGCMTGMLVGVFASGNGKDSSNVATFKEINYSAKQK